jgi:hypothetical protein
MFRATMAAAVISWLVINAFAGLLKMLSGRVPALPEPVSLLVSAIVYLLVFSLLFLFSVRRHLAWVTVSGRGLELAGTGRDPVFLPWDAVESVASRFRGPFTDLVVTPTRMEAAQIAQRGWNRPRTILRRGRRSVVVDTGLMRPGPAEVLAEIRRRSPKN